MAEAQPKPMPRILSYDYRFTAGGNPDATYAYRVTTDQGTFAFIPDSVVQRGMVSGNNQYYFPQFLNKDTLKDVYEGQGTYVSFDKAGAFDGSDVLQNRLSQFGQTPTGVLVPESFANSLAPQTYDVTRQTGAVTDGPIAGMVEKNGQLVYANQATGAKNARGYIDAEGVTHTSYTKEPRGFFPKLIKDIAPIAGLALLAYGGASLLSSLAGAGAGAAGAAGAGAGAAGAAGAGIAEGMLPGVLAAATPAELAAVNALVSPGVATNALAAGAQSFPVTDVSIPTQAFPVAPQAPVTLSPYDRLPTTDLYADLAGAAAAPAPVLPPTLGGADLYADLAGAPSIGAETVATAPSAFRPSENYGPGMTGAQTSAYDTVVDLTGSPGLASAAASGAGVLENIGSATGLTGMANAASAGSIWGPLITSLASLYGGSQAAQASERAAEITGAAANRAIDLQERMYREGVARQDPFYQAGVNALTQLQQRTGAMPPAFTGQVDLTRDPGYAFRLSEGLKGLERSAAARGGLMSGATGKALTRFGQEAASQEYQNAYNRALTEYNALRQRESEEYNRLSGLAGTGGTTAQQIGVAGQQMASNVGNIGMQQGGTAANALLSGAAARQSAYGDVGRAWGQYFAPQPVINYLGGRP